MCRHMTADNDNETKMKRDHDKKGYFLLNEE